MSSSLTTYIVVLCLTGVLSLFLAIYAFNKRHTYSNIVLIFITYVAFSALQCFSYAVGLLSTNIAQIKFWTNIQYIGIVFTPVLGLLFVLYYLGFRLSKTRIIALLIIPIMTYLIMLTNDWHHWHYRIFVIDPALGAPYVYQVEGPWYIVHSIYCLCLMLCAALFGISRWKETNRQYRPQLIALLIGQLIPIIVSTCYVMGWTPMGIDPVPLTLSITATAYLIAITHSNLFSLMPVAKETIFHSMNDGVVVLDHTKRLVDYNKAFHRMFPALKPTMLGNNFYILWESFVKEPFPSDFQQLPVKKELTLYIEELQTSKTYQVRITPLISPKSEEGYLLNFTDITELKTLQLQLERHAYYDELTQIHNRHAFFQYCNEHYKPALQLGEAFSIILLDIDYFKKVNDTYGHQVGDEVIQHIVRTCQQLLPEDTLFARYGGEEFIIALRNYSAPESAAIATLICDKVATTPYTTTTVHIPVTISVGVAQSHHEPLDELLNKADQALYTAKDSGRNQVHVCVTSFVPASYER